MGGGGEREMGEMGETLRISWHAPMQPMWSSSLMQHAAMFSLLFSMHSCFLSSYSCAPSAANKRPAFSHVGSSRAGRREIVRGHRRTDRWVGCSHRTGVLLRNAQASV